MRTIKITNLLLVTLLILTSNISHAYMFWNHACEFNGSPSPSWIAVPNSSSINLTGSFTLEAWVCPLNSANGTDQVIIEKRRLTGMQAGYSLFLNTDGKAAIRTNGTVKLIGSSVIPSNQWTHVAVSFNSVSDRFSIYVNSVLDTTVIYSVTSPDPLANVDSLFVGKGAASPYKGSLDEVRVWAGLKSAAEIQRNWRTTLGISTGIYDKLVLSFTFQDRNSFSPSFSLADWSGNNNNGYLREITSLAASVDLKNRPSVTINPNDCLELDGTDDYAAGEDNSYISPANAITLEAWVLKRSDTESYLIHKGAGSGSNASYRLKLLSSGKAVGTISGTDFPATDFQVAQNVWTHIAFTYNSINGRYDYYINGVKDKTGINSVGGIPNESDSLYIGGTNSTGNFNGFIDEVRISSYVKTESEIAEQLYKSLDSANVFSDGANVTVYNFDGYDTDNSDNGPRMRFNYDASFSHSGAVDYKPVSPILRNDFSFFTKSYYIETSNKRIPETGSVGEVTDTLKLYLDTTITSIEVFVALNHTNEKELKLTLIAPNSDEVVLFDNDSLVSNADNIVTIFRDDADSSVLSEGRYVAYGPVIKPGNSLSSALSGDNASGIWRLKITDETGSGTGMLNAWGIRINGMPVKFATLKVRSFIQGLFRPQELAQIPINNYSSKQKPFIQNTPENGKENTELDTINQKNLMSYSFKKEPQQPVDVRMDTPADSNGYSSMTIDVIEFVDLKYIIVNYKNAVETWSPQTNLFGNFNNPSFDYDFTNSASQAYGSNQIQVSNNPGIFAIYSGDVNQDGVIDILDVGMIDDDVFNFASGNLVTDLNGDGFVDVIDRAIADNNAFNYVGIVRP